MSFSRSVEQESQWNQALIANSNGPGAPGIEFAERFAVACEKAMKGGKPLAEVADAARDEAMLSGVSVHHYGFAIQTLVRTWEHGPALQAWHNTREVDDGAPARDAVQGFEQAEGGEEPWAKPPVEAPPAAEDKPKAGK